MLRTSLKREIVAGSKLTRRRRWGFLAFVPVLLALLFMRLFSLSSLTLPLRLRLPLPLPLPLPLRLSCT